MSDSHQGLPYPRRIIAIIAMCSGGLVLMIDVSIAAIVLPTIARDLNIDNSQAVLVVTTYQLILAMGLMPLAALGDRIGQRRLYAAGLVLHSLAALLVFLADDLTTLIAARSLQALGTGAAMSVAFGLIREIYPPEQLGKGLAINTVTNAGGTALAPVVGGLILSVANWQWVFSAAIPFSILALVFIRALPEPEPHSQPFDIRGAALCAATFGLIISGLEMTIHGPNIPAALGVLALGGLAAWVFVRHELKEPIPVLPVELLAHPALALALLSNFSAVIGSMVILLFMPFKLQNDFGFSPGEVGSILASYAVASMMIAPLSGYLSDRIRVDVLCTAGMALSAIGLFCVALLPEDPAQLDIAWRLWLCGAGFGMFFSPNARRIIGSAPQKRAASAGSMTTTSRMLGQATGATLMAGLLALGLGDTTAPILVSGGLVALSGLISGLGLLRGKNNC